MANTYNTLNKILTRALALIMALMLCLPAAGIVPEASAESDGMIRVKLARLGTPSAITLKTSCDYSTARYAVGTVKYRLPKKTVSWYGSARNAATRTRAR